VLLSVAYPIIISRKPVHKPLQRGRRVDSASQPSLADEHRNGATRERGDVGERAWRESGEPARRHLLFGEEGEAGVRVSV